MRSFQGDRLAGLRLPQGTVWLLEALAESKGRQTLYEKQSPQILAALREMALVESAESSNRIEGVTVDRNRLRPLVLGNARPRDRSEQEVLGYRRASSWVHTHFEKIEIEPESILRLHALAQGGQSGDAGEWKKSRNEIIEIFPDGSSQVRFRPVEPAEVASGVAGLDQAAEVYLASLIVCDTTGTMERAYLDALASALQLPPPLKADLERRATAD